MFRELVDRVRHQEACELLVDADTPIVDIAHRLGYSEAANFNHAFRRWTGSSPSRYRATMGARGERLIRLASKQWSADS